MLWIACDDFSITASVSRLMLADSIALICCSSVAICAIVLSSVPSAIFLRRRAALATVDCFRIHHVNKTAAFIISCAGVLPSQNVPVLFVLTFFLAMASCSSI